ncbi:MAG: hypothetical protein WC444_06970 [Candidatus Paceibacterota bacterium]
MRSQTLRSKDINYCRDCVNFGVCESDYVCKKDSLAGECDYFDKRVFCGEKNQ